MTTSSGNTHNFSRDTDTEELQDCATVKLKEETCSTASSTLARLPNEVLLNIFECVRTADPKSWAFLLQISQKFNRLASTLRYRTGSIANLHRQKIHSEEELRSKADWPGCSSPISRRGLPLEPLWAPGHIASFPRVRVIHLHGYSCNEDLIDVEESVSFPNLHVLHTHTLQCYEGTRIKDNCAFGSCRILSARKNPKLHTIVLYTHDMIGQWQTWCQSSEPFGDPDRLIVNWSYKSTPNSGPRKPQSNVRDGSSLQDLHVVLQPPGMSHVWGENFPVEQRHKTSEHCSNIGYLVEGLAELCASEATSITTAGAERIGPECQTRA